VEFVAAGQNPDDLAELEITETNNAGTLVTFVAFTGKTETKSISHYFSLHYEVSLIDFLLKCW